ncbi:MAG: hypothetical protein R3B06_31360 [Kofleriaceae bacterium]
MPTPSGLATVAALALTAACSAAPDPAATCAFPSGRPCPPGQACLASPGDECNYVACIDGELLGTAVACSAEPIPSTGGGPYDCDPASVPVTTGLLPPPAPCPLGGLYTIERGFFRTCVPVEECAPLPCDPAYGGDGCPSSYTCAPASRTCVPATR